MCLLGVSSEPIISGKHERFDPAAYGNCLINEFHLVEEAVKIEKDRADGVEDYEGHRDERGKSAEDLGQPRRALVGNALDDTLQPSVLLRKRWPQVEWDRGSEGEEERGKGGGGNRGHDTSFKS